TTQPRPTAGTRRRSDGPASSRPSRRRTEENGPFGGLLFVPSRGPALPCPSAMRGGRTSLGGWGPVAPDQAPGAGRHGSQGGESAPSTGPDVTDPYPQQGSVPRIRYYVLIYHGVPRGLALCPVSPKPLAPLREYSNIRHYH